MLFYLLTFLCLINFGAAQSGALRFFRNGNVDTRQAWSSGIVQIRFEIFEFADAEWGNICAGDSFGSAEADVVCRQQGYVGALSHSTAGEANYGLDDSGASMTDVNCDDTDYLTITQCQFNVPLRDRGNATCLNTDDVVVTCNTSARIWDSPVTGDIRLVGGNYSNEGLLEIYCHGGWGTVCDGHFHAEESKVACRQLGYNHYDINNDNRVSLKGKPSQIIWTGAQTSECRVDYSCLTSCQSCPSNADDPPSNRSCLHYEDKNLICIYSFEYDRVATVEDDTCDLDLIALVAALLIGVIVAVTCCCCCVLLIVVISISVCVCSCLGIGICAVAGSNRRPTTKTVGAEKYKV